MNTLTLQQQYDILLEELKELLANNDIDNSDEAIERYLIPNDWSLKYDEDILDDVKWINIIIGKMIIIRDIKAGKILVPNKEFLN